MKCKLCERPNIINNKFISSFIGSIAIFFGIGFILPLSYLSVYITSYIHLNQDYVTMHYGFFLNIILSFSMSFSSSLGGIIENKLGFTFTTLSGTIIILLTNVVFFKTQNIWICYSLTLVMGIGVGISISLLGKNLTLYHPKKKGIIGSVLSLISILFAAGFLLVGEKIINTKGKTLTEENNGIYPSSISKRTYIYLSMGFFVIPIGDIIFLLFSYEYDKKKFEKGEIIHENINLPVNNDTSESASDKNEPLSSSVDRSFENEKKEVEDKIDDIIEETQKKSENNNSDNNKIELIKAKKNVKKAIKKFRFWRITFFSFLLCFPISLMNTTGRTFGAIIGVDGTVLQYLTVLQSISIIILGPFLGMLSDKKGPLIILRIASIICIIPGIILLFFIDNTVLYIISFIIIAMGLVSVNVSLGPFIMDIYGIQESVVLGGIITGFGKLSEIITAVSAFVISFFYSNEEIKYPYKIMFSCGSFCGLLSFILLLFESKKKFDYEEDSSDLNIKKKTESEDMSINV